MVEDFQMVIDTTLTPGDMPGTGTATVSVTFSNEMVEGDAVRDLNDSLGEIIVRHRLTDTKAITTLMISLLSVVQTIKMEKELAAEEVAA